MTGASQTLRPPLAVRFILGVGAIVILSLVVFYLLMQPPAFDLGLMTGLLAVTAAVSVVAGYAAYRFGWIERSPTMRWTLLGSYILSSLLTFLNVYLTAQLMFANDHDLLLATVLLVFATGIAVVLGFFFSSALIDRINLLKSAAQDVASGDLSVLVPAQGNDELAMLARTFNDMATELRIAQRKQHELDTLRRDLIAWVSHDLQTPLASMRAIVEALADGVVDDPETVQRYLRTAKREINDLSLLIDDLFQVAQIDAGGLALERSQNSLADLISDTLESFSGLARQRDVSLRADVEPDVDLVYMDAPRIGRVLNNLVSNALRHTPPGGRVEVHASLQGDLVWVDVFDSGAGIHSEDLPHIFERFYRGEKSRSRLTGGAGLGLAIARGIVEAHGGQIGVKSSSGEGANFFFILPLG
jgi:signal transduction histidine kinase